MRGKRRWCVQNVAMLMVAVIACTVREVMVQTTAAVKEATITTGAFPFHIFLIMHLFDYVSF